MSRIPRKIQTQKHVRIPLSRHLDFLSFPLYFYSQTIALAVSLQRNNSTTISFKLEHYLDLIMSMSFGFHPSVLLFAVIACILSNDGFSCFGFSTSPTMSSSAGGSAQKSNNDNNILILDHINMNHGKGRHDWLKSFYGEEFLGCAWDPRKAKNLETGRKTLWANLGAHQFHLPEGSPDAQVLDGIITLVHPSPEKLRERYSSINGGDSCLNESCFELEEDESNNLAVTDPWGTAFRIIPSTSESDRDPRGSQPGDVSEGCAISDITVHVPIDANLAGIGRFYEQILGAELAPIDDTTQEQIKIQMGPYQTLTFVPKESVVINTHVDLREITEEEVTLDTSQQEGTSTTLGNYGVHISLYVADFASSYQKARDLGLAYVNTRFSRRAYTLEEAIDDCMFRCLDIVDPENPQDGPILQLEHEVRSVVKKDGSKYKSCPFDEIPEACITN